MTIIVSNYRGYYEEIHTEKSMCILFIKIKYLFKGYRVWSFPTLWMAMIWYKLFKTAIYKGTNVIFEKYINGSDQITYWQPYMNFH